MGFMRLVGVTFAFAALFMTTAKLVGAYDREWSTIIWVASITVGLAVIEGVITGVKTSLARKKQEDLDKKINKK